MQDLLRGRILSRGFRNQWTSRIIPPRTYGSVHRCNCSVAAPHDVTHIEKLILDNVKAVGPMSFATYMQFCLGHPVEGYYMNPTNPVFGPKGDFVTSPEISQLFGELIGVWLFSQWQGAGSPSTMRLLELGPGRGTLMEDILRTFKQLFSKLKVSPDIEVHLLENSLALRDIQRDKLSETGVQLQWHDTIDSIPKSPTQYTMLVAHEFFDALPIHILRKTAEGWKEIMVASHDSITPKSTYSTSDENSPSSATSPPPTAPETPQSLSHPNPHLQLVLSPTPSAISSVLGSSSPRFKDIPINSDLEVSPTSFRIARKVGELLAKEDGVSLGGCGLIIDYGAAKAFGDSRRAFRDHKVVDYFHRPGECDITANVDFAYLTEAMQDLVPTYPPVNQSTFLTQMGLISRLRFFAEQTSTSGDPKEEERWERIADGAKRLIDHEGMGGQYMFLGVSSNGGWVHPFGGSVGTTSGSGESGEVKQ